MKFSTKLVLPILALSIIGSSALAMNDRKIKTFAEYEQEQNKELFFVTAGVIGATQVLSAISLLEDKDSDWRFIMSKLVAIPVAGYLLGIVIGEPAGANPLYKFFSVLAVGISTTNVMERIQS